MRDAEVIVVGAGPAGATAALLLAQAGVDVLLLEKRSFPRDKLCGGFLAARTLGLLEELHGKAIPASLYHQTDDRFQIWHGGKLVADRRLGDRMAFVQRLEFDEFLVRQAVAAGARLEENSEVTAAVAADDGIGARPGSVVVKLRDGSERRGNWLIGADGALSRVRKLIDPVYQPGGTALELHCPVDESLPPRMDFGLFPWGYGWRFPKRGCQTVGLGGLPARTGNQRDLLRAYLQRLGLKESTFAGWPLPDHPTRSAGQGRMLLAGDAAGFCEPISGEGLYYALRSGQRAAQAVLTARGAGVNQASRELQKTYLSGTAHIRRQIRASLLFRHVFHSPRFQKRLLAAFCELPELGSVEWTDVFRVALRSLLRKG